MVSYLIKIVIMNNDVVIYQSADGLVKIEAMIDPSNETIWATQKAMAELFGVTVPNISYHFKRIFTSGELEPEMVIKRNFNYRTEWCERPF